MKTLRQAKGTAAINAVLPVLLILTLLILPHAGAAAASPAAASASSAVPRQANPVEANPRPVDGPLAQTASGSSVMFVENVGQFAADARFQMRNGPSTLWVADDAIWITVIEQPTPEAPPSVWDGTPTGPGTGGESRNAVNIKLTFPDANPNPELEPVNRLDTAVSYFSGSSPAGWLSDVPVWDGVRYVDLYPGVDLEMGGQGGQWSWQLACTVGAAGCQNALEAVRLRVEGADQVEATTDGSLRLQTAVGQQLLPLPSLVEPVLPETTVERLGERDYEVSSPVGAGSLPLAQAPNQVGLIYSGFLGGTIWDEARANAVDSDGNAYVTGGTWSSNFPTLVGPDPSHNGISDAFVAKVNSSGTALVYVGFLGGSAYDYGSGIAADGDGNAYVVGETRSADFPAVAGPDLTSNGNGDAFVAKVNAAGTGLVYSGYLGGSDEDLGNDVAVDGSGSAYVSGRTASTDFPAVVGPDLTYNGGAYDAFVAKVTPDGSALVYAGFLGGEAWEGSTGIAVDGAGSAYVTGATASSDFPTLVGPDLSYNGSADGFLTKVDATGAALVYSGYLGGSDADEGWGVAVDGTGNAYVAGGTGSSDFPVVSGPSLSLNGGFYDGFATKVDPTGAGLVYSGYLGGSEDDVAYDVAVDSADSAYIIGKTGSTDFPTAVGPDLTYNGGFYDAFATKLDVAGTGLVYSTFLGGTYTEWGSAIAVDGSGHAYLAGATWSDDFPTIVGPDLSPNGGVDAWVAKLDVGEPTAVGLSGLAAVSAAETAPVWPWAVAAAGLLLVALLVAWRRTANKDAKPQA